jgi:hypothetical protein
MADNWLNGLPTRNGPLASSASSGGRDPLRDASDAQMEQIRDLLFGGVRDEMLSRLSALERRVGALEQALATVRQEDDLKRRAAFDSLSTAVSDLGTQIRHLARP